MMLMTMKAILIFAVFAAVNACSNDNPCLYYGTCVMSRNTSSCQCQPGFTGALCENKLGNLVVCGTYTRRSFTSKNRPLSSLMETSLRLATCTGDTKCFNWKYRGNVKKPQESYSVDVSERRCIKASYCSQACTLIADRQAVSRGINITSCNSSCCDGDFCNAIELFINRTLVVSPCESSPCLNGATCKYANRNYTCVCQASFTGSHCESYVPVCQSSPCANNATCVDINGNYSCVCPALRTGRNCDIHIAHPLSVCQPNPCEINATCIHDNGNYSCVYSVHAKQSCEIGLMHNALRYIVGALLVVIIALLLCIMLLSLRLRKKNRLNPKEDIEHHYDDTNPSDIPRNATSEIAMSTVTQKTENTSHHTSPSDLPSQSTTKKSTSIVTQKTADNAQPDKSFYMDLKPRQDKNTVYQALEVYANENLPIRETGANTQGLNTDEKYMDLKPRQNVHYEKLSPKETTPAEGYEDMSC
ncbi:sushi, nidogen and EGF-like domain-containing protein 1 [Actinia tenebrosa]|uniref:Sushi, nidogen and EGF-like domain-containing protein 1 n=1 Tax=Actinia tenebrosa TaxID=6105 RepID=A0A6P8HYV2_ACTTE|nr:sushi, nidogen and EGF-like domain-containing protein 1 [Actinia tenebrosa]